LAKTARALKMNRYQRAGASERRQLWRRREELGKLHNLVAHVMASGKRTDIFTALQAGLNTGVAEGKKWKLIPDGGIRWNSSYMMIRRALELREALYVYEFKLKVSKGAFDIETFEQDYLSDDEWRLTGAHQGSARASVFCYKRSGR
jgi:hypothetical protein